MTNSTLCSTLTPKPTIKQIAVLRLHMPDGSVLPNQLINLDESGRIVSFSPLEHEVAFCEWYRGDWYCKEAL